MNLNPLFHPASIAIVGATERSSIGRSVIRSLQALEYPGEIYPVNPKYQTILDYPCFEDLSSIGASIDLVVICLGHKYVYNELKKAAMLDVGAAVIYGAGYAESGTIGKQLQHDITQLCVQSNIALCGPNVMGISSPYARCHTYMIDLNDPASLAGNVGLISQSGSVCIALTNDVRRYGFSHVISSGNEAVLTAAEYLDFLVDDNDTEVIALFLERVTDPVAFVAALARAAKAGKPVVVLKVGKSDRAAAAVTTHSGGLAGEAKVFSAMLKYHDAIEVSSLDEMSEVLAVCQSRPIPASVRAGVVTGSGGLAELMLDASELSTIELPPLSQNIRDQVEQTTGKVTGDGNPLDAWGNGNFMVNYPAALRALVDSPDHDNVLLGFDNSDFQPMIYEESGDAVIKMLTESKASCDKPHFAFSSLQGVFSSATTDQLRKQGIPVLSGVSSAFSAVAKVAGRKQAHANSLANSSKFSSLDDKEISAICSRKAINEFDAKRLLKKYQLPVPREHIVNQFKECRQSATALGYPVVLKGLSDDLSHKTEHGLVALNLRNEQELQQAWESLETIRNNLGENQPRDYLLQTQAPNGIEVIVGVNRDDQFGLVLMVGAGGILTELIDKISIRMLPVKQGEVCCMLQEAGLESLLNGYRHSPGVNVDALIAAIEAIAVFADTNGQWIESIDVNPIIAHQKGCVAVDALIIPRQQSREG